ncbi:protein of unknown function [Candidatus Methylomirabilis oxygeniifera]|uniref:Uncharacterized protein n=1 Tax=Methylomirabilis oxygeniifera TaxID=671143 RepID=D5MGL4_METO1|nr:protein of unknown function [Candidatus Methylomirabilis oxyfera]
MIAVASATSPSGWYAVGIQLSALLIYPFGLLRLMAECCFPRNDRDGHTITEGLGPHKHCRPHHPAPVNKIRGREVWGCDEAAIVLEKQPLTWRRNHK